MDEDGVVTEPAPDLAAMRTSYDVARLYLASLRLDSCACDACGVSRACLSRRSLTTSAPINPIVNTSIYSNDSGFESKGAGMDDENT